MKTFATSLLMGAAAAKGYSKENRNYGTTGHYGNQYGHGGHDDHDHADHIYGYDSVKPDKYLKEGDGLTRNEDKRDAIIVEVENANDARINYL